MTKTSVWVLWLVMMTPALIWTTWVMVYGNDRPLPMALAVVPFLVCPVLYAVLVQRGRRERSPDTSDSSQDTAPPSSEINASGKASGKASDPSSSTGSSQEAQALATLRMAMEGKLETTIPRLLDRQEQERLEACFSWSTFYLRQVEYRPQAAICHGQLRTNPDAAYATIGQKLSQAFSDRFILLLQEGQHGKPFFAIVPNPHAQPSPQPASSQPNETGNQGITPSGSLPPSQPSHQPTPVTSSSSRAPSTDSTQWLVDYQIILALALLALTLLTTTLMGAELLNNQTVLQRDWDFLRSGIPYSLSLVAILLAHEGSYYLAARSHRIPVTLPYLIPIPAFLGTCGVFSHLHGPIPDRKSLLDMSVAGPWGGLLLSLPLLGWGLSQSNLVPLDAVPNLFNVNALDPRYSLLLFLTSKIALPSFPAPSQGIALHPIAIAGYAGLWFTAIKLLPIGSFCGGRIIHAMVGQRIGAIVGQITRLVLLALSLVRTEFLIIALALFFVPAGDRPALNDVSALDNYRDFAGLITLVLAALILLPAPRL
ncbi:MAG: hypothetical protein AAGF75_09950, partial [Cyanobacteria bacterium P01_H01_bin.130]